MLLAKVVLITVILVTILLALFLRVKRKMAARARRKLQG